MQNEEDKELERIRQAKLQEMTRSATFKRRETTLNKPIEVTDVTFQEIIEKYPLVVVDCWAPWCGPCQMVAPIIEKMALDHAGRILFGKLNVDENPQIAMQYQIMSIPTLLVFKNGKLTDRIIGAMPRQTLETKITCYL